MANVGKSTNPRLPDDGDRKRDIVAVVAMGLVWIAIFAYGVYAKSV